MMRSNGRRAAGWETSMNHVHVICWIAVLAVGAPAAGQEYDVVQIPNLPGWPSMLPNDINDHGHATGIGFISFSWVTRAFHYDGEEVHDFSAALIDSVPPEYPFVGSRGLRINNDGHILFTLEVVDLGVFPYIWNGQDYIEVTPDIPPDAEAGASAINNHGVVAGGYKQIVCCWDLVNKALIWDSKTGATTIIEPLPPYTDSVAYDISDTGFVTGFVMGGPLVARGYVWKDGVMTLLGTVDEADYLSIGQRVNDAGFVGGFTTNLPKPGAPSMSRVMRWSNTGEVQEWAYPLGDMNAIQVGGTNNNNEVVGTMLGPQQPFHFHNGVLRNLNDHTTSPVPGLTLDLWDADAMNEKGQIVANGQYLGGGDWANYGFVLTPKPSGTPGDLNGDGIVDVLDLLMLLDAWGACHRTGNCPADLNGDGSVDVLDLLILLDHWG
jgi:hypothetical protein